MIVSAMRKPKYRLSPNEVERLVKEERERLRKLRIVQVREQAKANAALIRSQVKNEKERLLANFADEVKHEVLAEKEEKIRKLEQKYDSTLRSIGEGHAEVVLHGDGQQIAERVHKRLEDEERAMERYKMAKEKQDKEKAQEEWEASRNIRNRNLALEVESQRAAYMASLPPPKTDELLFDDKPTQKKAIQMTDMKSFAATHYHIPDYQVVKAGPDEQLYDAKADAEQADKRLKQDLKEKKVSHHEQVEKARIRGNEALHKEMLKHDLSDMMKDLSLLQRKDRRRRQVLLSQVPNQVFVPPEQCLQDREDKQVEMERQFEEMYMDKQQRPDASTLQTWSELPAGDDAATNEDSEMSTLESVPLPPSELATKDFTGKEAPPKKFNIVSRKPDTVLKQLLNKIKEQRINVLTNQKQDSGKEADAASLTSVSGSRASWRRSTENVDEESIDDFPVMGHGMAHREMDVKSVESGDTGSSGSKILHENNALIDELQQRIKKIEDQKLNLAQQLHSQSEFYQELQKQQQELQNLKLFPPSLPQQKPASLSQHQHLQPHSYSVEYDDCNEHTLEDVSIPSGADIDTQSPDSYFKQGGVHQRTTTATSARGDIQFGLANEQPIDLANAMSRLKPVAGILKGTRNPQFELLTSNGFLPPSLAMEKEVEGEGLDYTHGNSEFDGKNTEDARNSVYNRNALGQLGNINPMKEGGARRMIDFGSGGGGDVKKSDTLTGNLSARSDKSEGLSSGGEKGMMEDPMRKKVLDYHSRAQELHASMDESTLNKVRDYQQHIVQTHQDRKQLLETIRDDIERRRQALYSTSKFVGNGGAFLMNLGDTGSSARGQLSLPPAQMSSMPLSSSYPVLSSSTDARPFLSHSQSEKFLEPIKPFIADPWISNKKQQSILKPSSDFQGEHDLSKAGVGSVKMPSSIDRIKKSLAFDDLNESNADASPTFFSRGGADSLNDTTASRHSQAFTDDSKMTTSEEDRGSPILQGSRSDNWDTSDKSITSVTGSSSLNGSALVARAEERREGFERRQQELRSQLMDIQHQKEAILMRYYKGQQAIQDQQNVLRNRLLLPQHSSSGQAAHLDLHQVKAHPGTSSDGGSGTGSFTNDRLSGKSSKSSGSRRESLNLTGDEYLEEISYHQVKGTNEPTVSLNLPDPSVASSVGALGQKGVVTFEDEERMRSRFVRYDDQDGEMKHLKQPTTYANINTWASVLSSNKPPSSSTNLKMSSWATESLSHGNETTGSVDPEDGNSSGASRGRVDATLSSSSSADSPTNSFESPALPIASSSSQTPDHSNLLHHHHHHQPHELSTILEVDTPTATDSVAGSSVRLAPPSASQSLQSLYSQNSGGLPHLYHLDFEKESHHAKKDKDDSDIRIDPFPVLPVCGIAGASSYESAMLSHQGYNLATGVVGRGGEEDLAERLGYYDVCDVDGRGEGSGIAMTEVSLGAGSSCYTLGSEPADVESNLDTSGGF